MLPEFTDIRNHLAANATGITRDTAIATEIPRILFCKFYDELTKKPEEQLVFFAGRDESESVVKARIDSLFSEVKREGHKIFEPDERILLDPQSLHYVVRVLQRYEISEAGRDVVGEAFETFIGPTLRGEEGQFFTPRNLVRLMVRMVNPQPNELLIDPACGTGGFLVVALGHVWDKLKAKGKSNSQTESAVRRSKTKATETIMGLEKDQFLQKIARIYMAILGDGSGTVFCENSLASRETWSSETQSKVRLGTFDVVVTNPPFGARIPVRGDAILSQYDLGYEWKTKKRAGQVDYFRTHKLKDAESPQILFIERCLDLLREGGRMAIVLPEGILGNATTGYVRKFIRDEADVVAVVDCPLETFLPSTPTKVGILVLQKTGQRSRRHVFMATADRCGHDRRGIPLLRPDRTLDDDFPVVADAFDAFRMRNHVSF